jgi:hypothetical protein
MTGTAEWHQRCCQVRLRKPIQGLALGALVTCRQLALRESNWTAVSWWDKALSHKQRRNCNIIIKYMIWCRGTARTFSSVVTRKCSLIPWKIWWTSAYTSLSDEGTSLLFQSVLSNRSTNLVSGTVLDEFKSPFGLSCLLSFDPDDWSCSPAVEWAVYVFTGSCSGATKESRKCRNPARFYIQQSKRQ